MNTNTESLKKELDERLNEKFPEFEKEWKKTVRGLGTDFVDNLRKIIKDEKGLFSEISEFQLSIVIDNNFLVGQIKTAVEKGNKIEDSFIHKIANSNLIQVHAPHKIVEEIYAKIEILEFFNEHQEIAKTYASILLQQITIQDAQWTDDWKKANNLIGHIDDDDVPYLSLAFHVGSHAIISYDKIFKTQIESKVWTIQDLDRVITNYNQGFVSFSLIGGTAIIIKILWDIISAIFKVMAEVIISLIEAVGFMIYGVFKMLSKVPKEIYGIALIGGLAAYMFSEDFRDYINKKGGQFVKKSAELMETGLEKLKELLVKIKEALKSIYEAIKPHAVTTFEVFGFLFLEYQLMIEQVEKLELERAK